MKSTETNVKNVPEIKKLEENVINEAVLVEINSVTLVNLLDDIEVCRLHIKLLEVKLEIARLQAML